MESQKCKICGQTIEGFSEKDLEYRMLMHNIKHRNKSGDENEKIHN